MSGLTVSYVPTVTDGRHIHVMAHGLCLRLTQVEAQALHVKLGARLTEVEQRTRPAGQMTGHQNRYLHALLGEYGAYGNARFPILSGILQREITSTNDLTPAEASRCIDSLRVELSVSNGPDELEPW